jgi:hypothetical protein
MTETVADKTTAISSSSNCKENEMDDSLKIEVHFIHIVVD